MPLAAMPSDVSVDQWRKLYELAARVRALAPWTFMRDTMLFAVREPTTDRVGFVNVMGRLGEHFAVGVYLGADGLYGFATLAASGDDPGAADLLLEIPQVQLSFEDRAEVRPEDKAVIERLGLKFRGRNAWPLFRSFLPGYLPWFIDAADARMLECVLGQLLDVAPRFHPDGPPMGPTVAGPYLVRERSGASGAWHDGSITVAPPPPMAIRFDVPPALVERVRVLPRVENVVEIDCFMAPVRVAPEKGCRPSVAYALMLVDGGSGMILHLKLLGPDPDLPAMWGRVPEEILGVFATRGVLPLTVAVGHPLLAAVLEPIAGRLQLAVATDVPLRGVGQARRALESHFGR